MKSNRAADVVYNYESFHPNREQIVTGLEACCNPVRSCGECVYKQMRSGACIVNLMQAAAHMLREDGEKNENE